MEDPVDERDGKLFYWGIFGLLGIFCGWGILSCMSVLWNVMGLRDLVCRLCQ